jgi:hypothetical protein
MNDKREAAGDRPVEADDSDRLASVSARWFNEAKRLDADSF